METAMPPAQMLAALRGELELDLLMEAMLQCFGFDFRGHERSTLARRLHAERQRQGLRSLSALQDRILHEDGAIGAVLRALLLAPAAPFDDAEEAAQLRQLLGSCLHGAALPRVWLADCAGAGQAWTLAILLHQQQLLANTEIYATVASEEQLAEARQASFALADFARYREDYARSGGEGELLDYFERDGERAVLKPELRSHIVWAQYNLVTDASFNEFQLIMCRRALPDFGPMLRRRVQQLFHASLAPFGMLGLDRPLAADDELAALYQPALPGQPWYRRTG